jgi:hypothetical protein
MSKYSASFAALKHAQTFLTGPGQLVNGVRAMTNGIEATAAALVQMHDQPDPMLSELALNMRREATRAELRKLASDARERVNALIATERANIETNRAQKANLAPGPHSQEIRSVFRQMPISEKLQFLGEAVNNGDSEIVSALLTVPTALTGLTAEQASQFKTAYLEKIAPMDVSYIDTVADAANAVLESANGITA